MSKKTVRQLAVQCITAVIFEKQTLQEVMPKLKNSCNLIEDKALLQALCYGVLRYYYRLIWIAEHLLTIKIKPKDKKIFAILALGLYQLIFMRIPHHAAIKETVEVTKLIKKPWWTAMVNAVLRNYLRQEKNIDNLLHVINQANLDDLNNLSSLNASNPSNLKENIFSKTNHPTSTLLECQYLHPTWLIDLIRPDWPNDWENILKNNNQTPPLIIRINRQKVSLEEYQLLLQRQCINAESISNLNTALIIDKEHAIETLPGYHDGLFSVQDGAAQYAAELLNLVENDVVLDACAAPGVKTTHLFEMQPNIQVTAIDISETRLKRLIENCQRLQVKPTVIAANVCDTNKWWNKKPFDKILLDAPCSATGIIRRHPDIKFCRSYEDIQTLAEQQLKLLVTLWPLLKPGGTLVYATCSILKIENEWVLDKFLTQTTNAEIKPIYLSLAKALQFGVQILPGQNDLDGFYYAKVTKVKQ